MLAMVDPIALPAAQRTKRPISIEALLQWAISRSGRLPWMRDNWRELSMNHGLTAKPRRREKIGWDLATVGAGLSFANGRQVPAMMIPGPDAQRVLAAIQRLEPAIAAVVIACARARIRPDWMPGIEPYRVLRPRRHKKKHRRHLMPEWEPCSPEDLRAARLVYAKWRAALEAISSMLGDSLDGWAVSDDLPPIDPWIAAVKKSS